MFRVIICTCALLVGLSLVSLATDVTTVVGDGIECGKSIAAETVLYKPGDAEKYCKACACMKGYCSDETDAFHFLNGCMDGYRDYFGK